MYISANTAERIKKLAKSKNIVIKDMLSDCELSKNTLSSMLSRGSWIQANSLARIADYLGCSVDYLLGRTKAPVTDDINLTPREHTLLTAYRDHPEMQTAVDRLLGIDTPNGTNNIGEDIAATLSAVPQPINKK